MRFHDIKIYLKGNRIVLFTLFLSVFIPLIAGCSSFYTLKKAANKIARDLKVSGKDMKKRVGIVPFENQTFFIGQNIEQNLQKALVETIKKGSPDLLLLKPGDAEYPDALFEIPTHAWGRIDNFALAKIGRQLGLNAIIKGALIDISGGRFLR